MTHWRKRDGLRRHIEPANEALDWFLAFLATCAIAGGMFIGGLLLSVMKTGV